MKFLVVVLSFISLAANANLNFSKDLSFRNFDLDIFRKNLSSLVFETESWPEKVKVDNREYSLQYSINRELEDKVKHFLKKYKSDYTSVVILDNNTGKIISAIDYDKKEDEFGLSLSFSNTNPAASIFKVITAAELLENTTINKETEFSYNGRSSTLYRYQLKDKSTRWTRSVPFKKAFARSNNVVFGKAAIKNTSPVGIMKMAYRFGFNNDLLMLLDTGESRILNANNEYSLAELASGFNTETMISPLHGALIASVVANDGVLKQPTIIESVSDLKQERVVWRSSQKFKRVISAEASQQLKEMMELTIKKGTARGAFRPWKIKKIKNIEIGGKTGSITGGVPFGKRDWFISYAKPENDANDKGISICVMIVNVKRWYIKSTFLAKNIIQYYYDELNSHTGN